MTMTARLDEGLHALGTSVRPVPTPLPLLHPTSAAPALVADGATVSHRELAARVASLVEQLPATTTGRRLVHLPLTRRLDDVVAHLAVLAAGHVALVTGPEATSITGRFAPDLRLHAGEVEVLEPQAQHLLHPDLALLLCDHHGASLIVTVGHTASIEEFFDRTRQQSNPSTFLTRMKVGEKLVDAKAVATLYRSRVSGGAIALVENGDIIAIDIPNRSIELQVDFAELADFVDTLEVVERVSDELVDELAALLG